MLDVYKEAKHEIGGQCEDHTHDDLAELRGTKAYSIQESIDEQDHEAFMIDMMMDGQQDSVSFHNVGNEHCMMR